MSALKEIDCDLMIIGSGMAGMAAAMFAVERQLDTVQVGITGEINFASGLLDVLGIHPQADGRTWDDPWAGIRQLVKDEPRHPYARLSIEQIRGAMEACITFLGDAGLPYTTRGHTNTRILTPAGTLKTTYAFPVTMAAGAEALEKQWPTLLVDFAGLKGYSARQMLETIGDRWPGLKGIRLNFPGRTGELYTEHMARQLELPASRRQLADLIRPHLGGAKAVGLPAILGIYHSADAVSDLEGQLGVAVFEIPTMVPSVSGLRLREACERQLPQSGIRAFYQQKVLEAMILPDDRFEFIIGATSPEMRVVSRGAILSSGRFFGKGLFADRNRIREAIFDLPVTQPTRRSLWHDKDLLQPGGHPINRSGLETDAYFRPLDKNGDVIHAHLHAAGSILAHQDWIRQKCGSGLSIATAFGAIQGFTDSN